VIFALGSGLAAGAVLTWLMAWNNQTAWIVGGVTIAVFVLVLLHNPQRRFRRWFLAVMSAGLVANGIGFVFRATWISENIKGGLTWDGSVPWHFNALFAILAIVTAFLSYREWQHEAGGH
jgi:multisubunit Na+/H+ antiporter MnhB subunit